MAGTISHSLWREAYDGLNQKQRDILPSSASLVTPQDFLDAVDRAAVEAKGRRWKIKLSNGERFVLNDAFERIARWIQKFVQAVDVAVQYDPGHAALPWAALRVVLQACINDLSKHASIVEGIERLTFEIAWSRIQERLVLQTPSDAIHELRIAFVRMYQEILTFLANSKRFLEQGRARHMLSSVLPDEGDCITHLDNISRYKTTIESYARQLLHGESFQRNQTLLSLSGTLDAMEAPLQRLEVSSNSALDILNRSERDAVLDWISMIPYAKHHARTSSNVLLGTGQWLFSHHDFLRWNNSSSAQMLWLHGMPGSGKSTLLSIAIARMMEDNARSGSLAPVYFYCSRSAQEAERSRPEFIIRCLLRQMLDLDGKSSLLSNIKRRWLERGKAGDLSFEEAIGFLIDVIDERPATYIFVDALDECQRETRFELLNAFSKILTDSKTLVKIFVSSRDDQDLVLTLEGYPSIKIEAQNNQRDIELYVDSQVDTLVASKRLLAMQNVTDELRQSIKRRLLEDAQGMFRWVTLQLEYLCTFRLQSNIEQRLRNLPKTLGDSYRALYEYHHSRSDPEEWRVACWVFRWLLVNQAPLNSVEFIALVHASTSVPTQQLTTRVVLDLCFNLVVYDTSLDIFRLTHSSVREFLEQQDAKDFVEDAHYMATDVCLSILQSHYNSSQDSDGENVHTAAKISGSRQTLEDSAALPYAVFFWPLHASHMLRPVDGDHDTEFRDRIRTFLSPHSRMFEWWSKSAKAFSVANKKNYEWLEQRGRISDFCTREPHPLLVACSFGLVEQARKLISQLDEQTIAGSTLTTECPTPYMPYPRGALELASEQGHLAIIRELISKMILVNTVSHHRYCQAIRAAALNGCAIVLQLLLGCGVNEGLHHGWLGAARSIAAQSKQIQVFDILLRRGADIDQPLDKPFFRDALTYAASWGHGDVVIYLLKHGASPNAKRASAGKGALVSAAEKGHASILRTLLQFGAVVNDPLDVWDCDPLQAAVMKGQLHCVRILLDSGATPDTRSRGIYGNAVLAAAAFGEERIFDMLLENGRDINTFASDYDSVKIALSNSAEAGREKIVALLLNTNVGRAVLSAQPECPLCCAIATENERVVKLLLDRGADPNAQHDRFGSALACAAHGGNLKAMHLLIDRGADVNAKGGEYGTALKAASASGRQDTVQILLENRVDVNAQIQRTFTRNALQAAIKNNRANAVQLLLHRGAEPYFQDNSFDNGLKEKLQKMLDSGDVRQLHNTNLQA